MKPLKCLSGQEDLNNGDSSWHANIIERNNNQKRKGHAFYRQCHRHWRDGEGRGTYGNVNTVHMVHM